MSHIVLERVAVYSGRGSRFWERRIIIYLLKRGVYSGREGQILGGSHIVAEKGGIFWERTVDSGRVANITLLKRGYILGGRGRFWECHI